MRGVIFDMDGVLIDVRDSYTRAIYETVKAFIKRMEIKQREIKRMVEYLKHIEGFNCEWRCTDAIIKYFENKIKCDFEFFMEAFYSRRKVKKELVEKFEKIYKKYRKYEKPILKRDFLKKLKIKFKTAVFTGRPKDDAIYGLKLLKWEPDLILTLENYQKPSGVAIKEIFEKLSLKEGIYVGDSMDDLISVKEAREKFNINVCFISFKRKLGNCEFFAEKDKDIEKILKDLKWI